MREYSFHRKIFLILTVLLIVSASCIIIKLPYVSAQPTWPTSWIQMDWDKNENGPVDDWRDVEYAYFQYDSSYLYLKLKCYGLPGVNWPASEGRYKWFIDLDSNLYYSGGNILEAEYLLFVEDTDNDGSGEMYLVYEANGDGNFGEYEPWPPGNYADYMVTDSNAGGWRIQAPNQIEMYTSWSSIGEPSAYWLAWATDQENPNLDQGPTTDHVDEEEPIIIRDVAATSQTPTPTSVQQGAHVTIEVVVENQGTQTESFDVTCYFDTSPIDTLHVADLPPSTSTTLYFDWDTTGVPPDTYTIKAWADSSAAVAEVDESDNWCTAPATVTVEPGLVHDVAAVSQVPDNTSVVQGTIVNINVTVSNLGDYSETFNVTCSYNGNPISYQTVTDLAAEASTSIIFAWDTTGVPPGTYYIHAMADSSYAITEIDEENNDCTSFQAVTVSSPGAGEIFVDKVRTAVISGADPPVVGFTTTYELTIIVTNPGGSDVSNIVVNETISPDVNFANAVVTSQGSIDALPPPKIVWLVGTLTPGGSATLTFNVDVTPASLDLIYLNYGQDVVAQGIDTLTGDPVSDIGDTDITVAPIIRDVAATSQVPSSTVVCQGDTIAIQVTVKNEGNVTESFNVACYYDSTQIGVIRVHNLGAHTQTTISFPWDTTGIPPGTYSITAKADSSDEIAETDEANNLCTSPSTVKIVIHDIAVISQIPSSTKVTQGETVTIEVQVKNEGTEPETFNVSCYYDDTLIETKTVTDLMPDTTMTLSFTWDTTGVPPGTYYINAGSSTIPDEKDTDDNSCRSTVSITVEVEVPVGGYTVTLTRSATKTPVICYATLLALFAAATSLIKRKRRTE